MVVKTVRGFVENELYPLEPEVERTGRVPKEMAREIQRKVKALGFYAPNIPEEFGGGGLDSVTMALLERELGRTSWALHVWWGRPSNILCAGNDAQRERYLLPSVRGEKIDALAISEPDAGSDLAAVRTKAHKVDGGWILNGSKVWTSGAHRAEAFCVDELEQLLLTRAQHQLLSRGGDGELPHPLPDALQGSVEALGAIPQP